MILKDIKEKQSICFPKVGLQVGSQKSGKISIKQAVIRKFGRELADKEDFDVINGEENTMAVVSTPKFDGTLEYSKVIFTFDVELK